MTSITGVNGIHRILKRDISNGLKLGCAIIGNGEGGLIAIDRGRLRNRIGDDRFFRLRSAGNGDEDVALVAIRRDFGEIGRQCIAGHKDPGLTTQCRRGKPAAGDQDVKKLIADVEDDGVVAVPHLQQRRIGNGDKIRLTLRLHQLRRNGAHINVGRRRILAGRRIDRINLIGCQRGFKDRGQKGRWIGGVGIDHPGALKVVRLIPITQGAKIVGAARSRVLDNERVRIENAIAVRSRQRTHHGSSVDENQQRGLIAENDLGRRVLDRLRGDFLERLAEQEFVVDSATKESAVTGPESAR